MYCKPDANHRVGVMLLVRVGAQSGSAKFGGGCVVLPHCNTY